MEFWNFALGNLFLWKSALSENSKYTVCVSIGRRDCNTIKTKVCLDTKTVLKGYCSLNSSSEKSAVCHVRF